MVNVCADSLAYETVGSQERRRATPEEEAVLVVGVDQAEPPQVRVNGVEAEYMDKMEPPEGVSYETAKVVFDCVDHFLELAPHFYRYRAPLTGSI